MKSEWKTRQTLIQRAKDPNNEEAWEEFVLFYKRFIYFLLNRLDISIDEIDDLVQEILITLWKKLPLYQQKKAKFRNWLAVVIRNTSLNYLKKLSTYKKQLRIVENLKSLDSFSENEITGIVEREWKLYLTNLAMERLKKVFGDNAIAAFNSSFKGKSADQIAAELGISENSVYTLRARVKNRLVREIRLLMEELEF